MNKVAAYFYKWIDYPSAIKFLAVGATSALVYFLSFSVLWHFIHFTYQIAVSIAYALSVVVHFTANRRITFRAHGHALAAQLTKYFVMVAINYGITLWIMHGIVTNLNLTPYLGIMCSIALTVATGYLMAKFWVFRIPIKT